MKKYDARLRRLAAALLGMGGLLARPTAAQPRQVAP
jgi:hypothetical protein